MPAPFSSVDPGEAWVWGDYVALMQTRPVTVTEMMVEMTGTKGMDIPAIEYPFVMTVFYRKDRNPHGPSARPILVATLEKMDYAAMAKIMTKKGMKFNEADLPTKTPVVQGLFTGDGRFNLGEFDQILTKDTARQYFLNWMRQTLSLPGEPEKIGTLKDVYGNPKTGWEPHQAKAPKKGGCAAVLAGWVLLAVAAAILVLQFLK